MKYGTKHFHDIIVLSKEAFKGLKGISAKTGIRIDPFDIIKKYLTINAFWCYPENVLFCAFFDSRLWVRQIALKKIEEIRERVKDDTVVRKFTMDKVFKSFLNFEAKEPHEVIPLDRILNRYLFEPPYLQLDEERNLGFTLDQLRKHARYDFT